MSYSSSNYFKKITLLCVGALVFLVTPFKVLAGKTTATTSTQANDSSSTGAVIATPSSRSTTFTTITIQTPTTSVAVPTTSSAILLDNSVSEAILNATTESSTTTTSLTNEAGSIQTIAISSQVLGDGSVIAISDITSESVSGQLSSDSTVAIAFSDPTIAVELVIDSPSLPVISSVPSEIAAILTTLPEITPADTAVSIQQTSNEAGTTAVLEQISETVNITNPEGKVSSIDSVLSKSGVSSTEINLIQSSLGTGGAILTVSQPVAQAIAVTVSAVVAPALADLQIATVTTTSIPEPIIQAVETLVAIVSATENVITSTESSVPGSSDASITLVATTLLPTALNDALAIIANEIQAVGGVENLSPELKAVAKALSDVKKLTLPKVTS